jgi:molecular chaperone GrpE
VTINGSITAAPSTEPAEPVAPAAQAGLKAQLMSQFENWLDQMLLEEPPPRGIPERFLTEAEANTAEDAKTQAVDLYTLFSGLTGLTGEIGLQGRAFKQLSELLAPLSETPAILAQLREAQKQSAASIQSLIEAHENEPEEEPVQFKAVCDVMIDLYDRLQRGLQTCDEGIRSLQVPRKIGLLQRLLSSSDPSDQAIAVVKGIREAAAMTLGRLGAALQEWGVQRIGNIGESFDPDRMTAIEARPAGDVEPGRILVVNRSGYALNGALKSAAQVTVSQKKKTEGAES